MEIINIIRGVNTEKEIYSLLTSYIDALRHSDNGEPVAQQLVALPLTGKDNLQARFEKLIIELDRASKGLDDKACVVIKEALNIFSAALNRLWLLERQRRWPLADVDRQAAITWPAVQMAKSDLPSDGQVIA